MKNVFSILIILAVICMSAANAQINEFKITASDGQMLSLFGESVSISGDYAIVGVYSKNSAYIYRRDGGNWTEQAKLSPTDYNNNVFGFSVAISGDYCIVGASGDNDIPSNGGAVYFYERDSNTDIWTQVSKHTAGDGAGQDEFGVAVAISGDYAIVGSHKDDDKGLNSGSAYIFKRSEGIWIEQAKLTASDGAEEDDFGARVSITDDYAIVGAPFNRGIAHFAGAAYIFKRDASNWTEQVKLTASDGAEHDYLGMSVSIDGDYAIVGATGPDGNAVSSGAAYVFNRDGESWTEQAKIYASDGGSSDMFGFSAAIDGNFAIVGAFSSDGVVPGAGSAYIFSRDGTNWMEINKLTASDGAADDKFGTSVSIDGEYAIVGASFDDDNGELSGSAYIYDGFFNTVGIKENISGKAGTFILGQNYPNPFYSFTTIKYKLPKSSLIELKIYNLAGQEVETLINEFQSAGLYEITWQPKGLPGGLYFYKIHAGEFTQTRKSTLLK